MFHALIKKIITSQLIIYITRCFIGFLIGYYLYLRFPDYGIMWALISIILVISPEGQNSKKLSIERFKSNLIGSSVGFLCLLINEPNVYICLLGVFLTILVCYLFNVINMARVALVTLIIILVQPHTSHLTETPLIRGLSVTIGCFIGLGITVFTSMLIRRLKRYYGIPLLKQP